MSHKRFLILAFVALLLAPVMHAGPLNRVISPRASSRLFGRFSSVGTRSDSRTIARILARDHARDVKAAIRVLERPRTVHRYTTIDEVKKYLRQGIPSGVHFTARANPGRPLSAERAAARYGLPKTPSARVKIELPPGTRIKSGKVVGGHFPGYGEVKTYRSPLAPSAVKGFTRVAWSSGRR